MSVARFHTGAAKRQDAPSTRLACTCMLIPFRINFIERGRRLVSSAEWGIEIHFVPKGQGPLSSRATYAWGM